MNNLKNNPKYNQAITDLFKLIKNKTDVEYILKDIKKTYELIKGDLNQ